MNELNNKLFALLRSVLCTEELNKSLFEGLNEETLAELYKISKKHDMAHIVGEALDCAGLLDDGDISRKLAKQQLVAIYRYENIQYEIDSICAAFDKANIPYIPLKGSVIRALYPEPWMRTSCDIDILVHENDLDTAVDTLKNDLVYKSEKTRDYHDISLYSESGVHLELHFSIKENISDLDRVLSRVWEYATHSGQGYRYDLSKEFFIYHAVAHDSYHFANGGCGIRAIVDLWYLTKDGNFDDDLVLSLCRESGIERFYLAILELSQVWFGKRAHSDLSRRMENYILSGGAYGETETGIAMKQDARGGKVGYILSKIFVSYEHLRGQYPSLKCRAMIPVYQVRRWIDSIAKGRLARSAKSLKTNAKVDKSNFGEAINLLSELGLKNHLK